MIKFCYGEEADIKTISDKNAIIATSDTNKFYAKIDGVVHQMSDPVECLSTDSVSTLISGKLYFETDTSKLFYLHGTAKIYTNSGSTARGSNITVDTELSITSTNPVQNKVIKEALDEKVSAVDGKGLSTEDFTTEEKTKLSGLENTIVDAVLNSTSTNPVQNKVIYSELESVRKSITAAKSDDSSNVLTLIMLMTMYHSIDAEGTFDNVLVEDFSDSAGYTIVRGAYDAENKRVYA